RLAAEGSPTMAEGSWYNGYSPRERGDKLKAMKHALSRGELLPAQGPCALCNDPEVPVEYHDEDYGAPFIWRAPAMYALCRNCHRDKLHKRFWRHTAWLTFLAHVRRGGYARELADPAVKIELKLLSQALERGESFTLRQIRPYPHTAGDEWFSRLRLDPESLTDSS